MTEPAAWHPLLKMLHWASVVVILGLYALGWYMVQLDYYDSWYHTAPTWHKAFGLLWCLIILLRLALRAALPGPQPLPTHAAWERVLATVVHVTLYALLFFIFMTGYIIATADGRGINLFDLLTVPALFSEAQLEEWLEYPEDVAGEWHELAADGLIVLVALHALGALKHHFIDRDTTLRRMTTMKTGSSNTSQHEGE